MQTDLLLHTIEIEISRIISFLENLAPNLVQVHPHIFCFLYVAKKYPTQQLVNFYNMYGSTFGLSSSIESRKNARRLCWVAHDVSNYLD